jgi:hypothetical protein
MSKLVSKPVLLIVIVALLAFIAYRETERMRAEPDLMAMFGAAEEESPWELPAEAMHSKLADEAFQEMMPEMLKQQEAFLAAVASSGVSGFGPGLDDPETDALIAARTRDVEALGDPGTSESEVRAFLDRLTEIASTQRLYGTGMPEPEALKKLRPEDLPILLEYMDTPLGGHTPTAIEVLATEEHKDLLLKAFEKHPKLAPAIEKMGWAPLCGEAIARHLRKASSMEKGDWVRIGVSSRDPIVYREIIESYFETGIFGGDSIYRAAAAAPDFPLESFHDRIWDEHGNAPLDDDAIQMLALNIEHGSVRALDIAARAFTNDGFQFSEKMRVDGDKRYLEFVIKNATPEDWNYESIVGQRDAIVYDKDTRKFGLTAGSES